MPLQHRKGWQSNIYCYKFVFYNLVVLIPRIWSSQSIVIMTFIDIVIYHLLVWGYIRPMWFYLYRVNFSHGTKDSLVSPNTSINLILRTSHLHISTDSMWHWRRREVTSQVRREYLHRRTSEHTLDNSHSHLKDYKEDEVHLSIFFFPPIHPTPPRIL